MLLEIFIKDFAIIDKLSLHFNRQFNVFTGETGAGKSIIIDAVGAALGEKMGLEVVRAGAEQARVEALFEIGNLSQLDAGIDSAVDAQENEGGVNGTGRHADVTPDADARVGLAALLHKFGITAEDNTLIITREFHKSGRSTARVNSRIVPLSALQELGQWLVDIHGQSAHLSLLRPEQHINFLDRYAILLPHRQQIAALVGEWRGVIKQLRDLEKSERDRETRQERLRFEIDEIRKAKLKPSEADELNRERIKLNNAEKINAQCLAAQNILSEGDEQQPSVLDLLTKVSATLRDLSRLDSEFTQQEAIVAEASYRLQDAVGFLRDYQEGLEFNPKRLAAIEERLDLIYRLKRKYGVTIEAINTHATAAEAELDNYGRREEQIAALTAQDQELRHRISAIATLLSFARRRAARELSTAMERQLGDLNMKRARFQVSIVQQPREDGVWLPDSDGAETGQQVAFDGTGVDRVEFMIAPNPGEPFKPLVKIASGGEASRLMLALKSILSAADATPTLIFDEIDTGVGGRIGQIVGEKLWSLTQNHQVICITHLPQIAAFGDAHYSVTKEVVSDRTRTIVTQLDHSQRTREISQMLTGNTSDTVIRSAQELLERARAWKSAVQEQAAEELDLSTQQQSLF